MDSLLLRVGRQLLFCSVFLALVDKRGHLIEHFGHKIDYAFRRVVIRGDMLERHFAVVDDKEGYRCDCNAGAAAAAKQLVLVFRRKISARSLSCS